MNTNIKTLQCYPKAEQPSCTSFTSGAKSIITLLLITFCAFTNISAQCITQPASPSGCGYDVGVTACYNASTNTTQFTYTIKNTGGAKDLSHWELVLAECITPDKIVSLGNGGSYSSGGGGGQGNCSPKPNIKFDRGTSGTNESTFTFTLTGSYSLVQQDAYFKRGTECCLGKVYGPVCCTFTAACKSDNTVVQKEGCDASALPPAETNPSVIFNITKYCGKLILTSKDVTTSSACPTKVTRTYTVFDDLDNDGILDANEQSLTCNRYFEIVDTKKPVFTYVPEGKNLGCNPANIPGAGTATATDNCSTPTITTQIGSVVVNGCSRSQTITYTAEDACHNQATATQVYTWTVDTEKPVFTKVPAGGDLGCNPAVIPGAGAAEATDNCGTPTITAVGGEVSVNSCARSQTITYTAEDACGNKATATQMFTWTVDTQNPVFTYIPAGGNLGCNPTSIPGPGTATATDNCGTPTITVQTGNVMTNGCSRSQTITYTAEDACHNKAIATQVYTWTVDTEKPVITCSPDKTIECNAQVVFNEPTASDNCGTPTISIVSTTVNGSVHTRIWRAVDACGNESRCSQTITVKGCSEGCTPGYWKNHPEAWTYFKTTATLESVFNVPDNLNMDNITLLAALDGNGGPGVKGAAEILLRAAVAALLNSTHSVVDYPRTTDEIITAVNTALASGDRNTILQLAKELDADNNLGCPLNNSNAVSITSAVIGEPKAETVKGSKITATASPNPFQDKIRFNLVSPVTGQGSLQIYNSMGQNVTTVFQGLIQAGVPKIIDYTVPSANRTSLIYSFKLGNQQVTGKLLH
jgi:hypothetical protein